ncbi:methylmalonyl-CoA mutase [Serratia sp. NPDC078593]|uniref:methylmalonyl-CoA mutase n=1 Tax=unclassified Serratia (in: enterobacteria) TaxID=2647522 RepID=UPI0037D43269
MRKTYATNHILPNVIHTSYYFDSLSERYSCHDYNLLLKPVYCQDDISTFSYTNTSPGEPPYIRGPNATMYTVKPWTIRQYAGFSTSQESNTFYRKALASGMQGISVAFDLATHRGYDSDHPHVEGDVGKAGVAIDSVDDMKALFEGIPLGDVSVSMTMNGAVLPIMAAYIVAAEESGVSAKQLKGTIQNDILKEFMVRNTYIYPPTPSMRIVTDILAYTAEHMPQFNALSISGYHMQEAGAPDMLELALTLANGKAYVQAALDRGLNIDNFAGRLSFFFGIGMDFYANVAKLRAARLLWCQIMQAFGAQHPRSLKLRTHCQTSGWSLTEHDPLNNVVRTTIEAMAAVFGGTQSLHTNAFDEAMGLPTDQSARLARNTQLILQEETAICDVVDPWAGSYMMETLTMEIADGARKIMTEIGEMGGMLIALENGWIKQQIERCSANTQAKIDSGNKVIVGVNKYKLPGERAQDVRFIDNSKVRAEQIARLTTLRQNRNEQHVTRALAALTECARSEGNLLAAAIAAIRLRATVGEVTEALVQVWGRYQAEPQFVADVYGAALKDDPKWQPVETRIEALTRQLGTRPKILIAKMGQDGHDRGAKVVASGLHDMGFEVMLSALFQTPEEVVQQACTYHCHAIGVSSLVAGHNTLIPMLMTALAASGRGNIIVFVGGVIPAADYSFLFDVGVADIFGPGTPLLTCADRILEHLERQQVSQMASATMTTVKTK